MQNKKKTSYNGIKKLFHHKKFVYFFSFPSTRRFRNEVKICYNIGINLKDTEPRGRLSKPKCVYT